jgi:hypothetical protein
VPDLRESVERLRSATRRSAFGVLAQQAATGPVSEKRVRLQRVIPMIGNSFKPFFFGRFEQRSDGVYLTGRFTMLGIVKVFMTFWLVAVLAFGIGAVVATQRMTWQGVLSSLGMFVAGLAGVGLGKWLARNDVAWLSDVIRGALGTPADAGVPSHPGPAIATPLTVSAAPPTVLRIAALVLFVGGLACVWAAASGVSSWHASFGEKATVTRFSSSTSRLLSGTFGLAMMTLAVGVYRRRAWAWSGTLALIVGSGLMAVPQIFFLDPGFPDGKAFRVIFGVLSLAITAYWGWWWYAQRMYFDSQADLVQR